MHRKTKRPAEHLNYWATGLLGYWATEQSAGKKKFAFSSTCLVTPIYPERKRVWRSTLPGFCLLLTLFENLCMLAVFSCFCASNGTRGRLFPVSSFSISERIFLASYFYGAEGCCRGRRPSLKPPHCPGIDSYSTLPLPALNAILLFVWIYNIN